MSPVIIFMVVDLPEPLGPRYPVISPGARRKADVIHRRDAGESLGDVAQFEHALPYVASYLCCLSSSMLHRYNPSVALEPKLSHTAAMILQAIHAGHVYGYSVMEMTGLPSGTVYPALRRLERDDLIRSQWESQSDCRRRPAPAAEILQAHALRQGHAGGFAQALSAAGQADGGHGGGERMTLPLAILRTAALLVPGESRAEWLAEWRSELWYVHGNTAAFCAGAFRDALWVRRNRRGPACPPAVSGALHPGSGSAGRGLRGRRILPAAAPRLAAALALSRRPQPGDDLLRRKRPHARGRSSFPWPGASRTGSAAWPTTAP